MIWTPTDQYMANDAEMERYDRFREHRERFATYPYEEDAPPPQAKALSRPSAAQLEAEDLAAQKQREEDRFFRESYN